MGGVGVRGMNHSWIYLNPDTATSFPESGEDVSTTNNLASLLLADPEC